VDPLSVQAVLDVPEPRQPWDHDRRGSEDISRG